MIICSEVDIIKLRVIKSKGYVRKEGKKAGRKGIYRWFSCLVNTYTEQNRIQVAVLAELGRIRWTWQDSLDLAEYGRMRQIAIRLPQIAIRLPFRGRSLLAASVETGGRV
jgi:hypothetical protein